MPTQGPISNQEPQPELTAQAASRSSRQVGPEGEPPAPAVGAHVPQHEPTPVSNVPPETGSVQHLPPPMPAGPSTPAGHRRARLSPTPPSVEAERHPPKRTRGEGSGDEGEGGEGVQPSLPIPPPIFENNNTGSSQPQITQANGETPSTVVQQPHPGDGQPTTLQDQQNVTTTGNPEGGSSHSSQLPAPSSSNMSNFQSELAQDAETDPDTSMESAPTSGPSAKGKAKAISPNVGQDSYLNTNQVSSPRPMEWDPEGHSPHIPAASPESKPERERRAAEDMDFELEAPLASGSGVGQASISRPIKPLRPARARRGLSRVPPWTSQRSSPMSDSQGSLTTDRTVPPNYGTPGYRCGSSVQPDPKSPTSRLEPPCSKNTSEDIVMTGGPGLPTEQTSPEGNTTNTDKDPSYIPPMSEVTDSDLPDRNDEQSFTSAQPENQPQTSDDESDLSDYLEEAKASNYSSSNAIAAAAIEDELEEASDSEGRTPTPPMYPAEHGASHLHATTLAFGLHSARGGNVGARSVARLGDLPSIFSTWSISGPSNVGDSTDASPVNGGESSDQNSAGGAADDGEEEEDIFPLI
ncbi:hypothetical protein FRC04_012277 [Tulasnella sp. 424]|nr:hypothetical protein FRC04_012277 [Tulasnella sp. 424]